MKQTITLGDLALPSGMVDGPFGSNLKASEYVDRGIPIIRLQNIKPGLFVEKDTRFIAPEKAKELSRHDYKPGDLVIAKLGDPSGVTAMVPANIPSGIIVADVVRFRGDPERVSHEYLCHFLNSENARRQIRLMSKGSTRQRCNLSDLKSIELNLPSLKEQKRIAAILDKAGELRRKRREAMQLADDFLRAVFLDMFGDPVTNPKGWPVLEVVEVCDEIVDCVNRTAPTVDYETDFWMVRTTNVRNYSIDLSEVKYVAKEVYDTWTRRLLPKKGDILFTREAPAGEAGVIETNDSIFLGQRMMHFRPDFRKITSSFLLYELMDKGVRMQIDRAGSGSTVKHLSVPECKQFKVRVPPVELQERFELIVRNVKNMISLKDKSGSDLDSLASSFSYSLS